LPDEKMAQWSLRWILDHPQVTTVIPGATKIEQVKSNVAASDLPQLPNLTHQKLRALYDEKIRTVIRGRY
jgi:aryl-alcohol dehydrogenase-like predicted oxidoreductase